MKVEAARHSGRSHRRRDVPCQDAVASWQDPAGWRACVAVADGLGSKPLSQHGSQAACDAAIAHLAGLDAWDGPALQAAIVEAVAAIARAAHGLGVQPNDLATTLQVATWDAGTVHAAMVGDGAVVAVLDDRPEVLLAPPPGQYANEVVPITHGDWPDHVQVATATDAGAVLVFSDGLVRLLLRRERSSQPSTPNAAADEDATARIERPTTAWRPHEPFFSAFLPRLGEPGLVRRFVEGDDVDAAWDDDKSLAVIAPDDD